MLIPFADPSLTPFFGYLLGLSGILFFLSLVFFSWMKQYELLTPLSLYLGILVIDVFIPLLVLLTIGFPDFPFRAPYITVLENEDYVFTALVHLIAALLTLLGYFCTTAAFKKTDFSDLYAINFKRAGWVLGISAFLYLGYILIDIFSYESWAYYAHSKALRQYGLLITDSNVLRAFLLKLLPLTFACSILLSGLFFHNRIKSPFLFGMVIPFFGWLLALSTGFRGSQLNFFMMILILYNFEILSMNKSFRQLQSKLIIILSILLITASSFTLLGALRNFAQARSANPELMTTRKQALIMEARRLIRGEGLTGLAWILKKIPRDTGYLKGKTFKDILLMPVPRAVYLTKPEWYGIADITRSMGGPKSTQDAVTIPGELYANFGFTGIPLIILWGVFLGFYYNFRNYPRFKYIYAFSITQMMTTTNWMSFTGFCHAVMPLPVIYLFLLFIIHKKPDSGPFHSPVRQISEG